MTTANVRERRLQRGWTLEDLAKKCADEGVTTSAPNLHRIEVHDQVPRPRLRVVLARLLDLEVNDFEPAAEQEAAAS